MQIGILGTGNVGSALTESCVASGHTVTLGSRTPETAKVDIDETAGDFDITTQSDTIRESDVIVFAVPPDAAVEIADDKATLLANKTIIDPTNEYPTPTDDTSVATRISEAAPNANVVKAFNTIGAEHMVDPEIDGESTTMFIAGDDSTAVDNVKSIVSDIGFDPFVAGDLDAAGHLEDLGRFWIHLSIEHGRDVGYHLLRE
ncbi:MAG: NADPH-dependent F420 reductase [Halobacteriaceae archaeon]